MIFLLGYRVGLNLKSLIVNMISSFVAVHIDAQSRSIFSDFLVSLIRFVFFGGLVLSPKETGCDDMCGVSGRSKAELSSQIRRH